MPVAGFAPTLYFYTKWKKTFQRCHFLTPPWDSQCCRWPDKHNESFSSPQLSLIHQLSCRTSVSHTSWLPNTPVIHSIKPITCHEGLISYTCVWCSASARLSAGPLWRRQIGLLSRRRWHDLFLPWWMYQSAALLPCPPNLLCDTIRTRLCDDKLAAGVY